MLDAALHGILDLFSWPTAGFLLIGITLGLLVGLIPGIGSMTMFSILLPFAIVIDSHLAFALVVGAMSVGNTSDSITAILMGIPGGNSSATIIDGYAMSRKGQAARALGASFTASVIGGLFGALLLSFSIPIVRPLVLSFGSPEFLVMSLWALSLVAMLSGTAPLKGLVTAGIGVLLGAVGSDPSLGFSRWTFGSPYLLEGITLALIGLSIFAIPEMISFSVTRKKISDVPVNNLFKGQLQGVKDTVKHPGLVLRTSGVGALIGAIPGLGNSVVDWIAYGLTVQTSKKKKDQFGKGDVRAIIGIEASNNATTGGALIPTLAFGIPGGATTAFLLIVLYSHGVSVGSHLFTNTNNLSLVYFLLWGVVAANIIGGLICFSSAGFLAKLTTVPYYYLFALLIPVVFIASYYAKNNVFDLYFLVILGLLGYLFKQLSWPRPPLLIGFVLSNPIEANLRTSLDVYGMSWIGRPIVIVFIVIIALSLYFTIRWSRSLKALPQTGESRSEGNETVESKNKPKLYERFMSSGSLLTVVLICILSAALMMTFNWPATAAILPKVVGSATLLFLVAQLVKDLLPGNRQKQGMHFDIPPDLLGNPRELIHRILASFGWVIGILAAVIMLGIAIALPLFTLAYLRFAAKLKLLHSVCFSLLVVAFIVGFGELTNIYWNQGKVIGFLLGTFE